MTNPEKAAILLLSLGEELAAEVIQNFKPDEVRLLGTHMGTLREMSKEDVEKIAGEFCAMAGGMGRPVVSIQGDAIRNIFTKAMGEEKAKKILKAIERDVFKSNNPIIDKLQNVDPIALMEFAKTEHPQTIALILAHLRMEQVAGVLENLPSEKQIEIVKRMATLKSVPREFIDEIARTLESELVLGEADSQTFGGTSIMAEILNEMSRSSGNAILKSLEDEDADLAAEIRNLMFTFDDIFELDDRSIRAILQEVSSEDLARALKIVDQDMRGRILENMSKRAGEMLMEDIELMPPTRLSDVEQSQRVFIEIARKLEKEGRITIAKGGDRDEFV